MTGLFYGFDGTFSQLKGATCHVNDLSLHPRLTLFLTAVGQILTRSFERPERLVASPFDGPKPLYWIISTA